MNIGSESPSNFSPCLTPLHSARGHLAQFASGRVASVLIFCPPALQWQLWENTLLVSHLVVLLVTCWTCIQLCPSSQFCLQKQGAHQRKENKHRQLPSLLIHLLGGQEPRCVGGVVRKASLSQEPYLPFVLPLFLPGWQSLQLGQQQPREQQTLGHKEGGKSSTIPDGPWEPHCIIHASFVSRLLTPWKKWKHLLSLSHCFWCFCHFPPTASPSWNPCTWIGPGTWWYSASVEEGTEVFKAIHNQVWLQNSKYTSGLKISSNHNFLFFHLKYSFYLFIWKST